MSYSRGMGTRYDQPAEAIERARKGAPGPGFFMNTKTRWCGKCLTDKPALGAVRRGSLYWCADCLEAKK